jgi:very-short-patch-repair endonuclease
MDADRIIYELSAKQHGLVSFAQLRSADVPTWVVGQRVAAGRMVALSERVFYVAGSAPTAHRRVMAAVLDGGDGAALARGTAFALWGVPGFLLDPAHVVRSRARRGVAAELGVAHVSRTLGAHHVVELYGIPVCTPARALVDLAAEVSYQRLERVCDQAWSRRLLTGVGLHEIVAELGGRGRTGMAKLRQLVDERPLDYRPPESNLEARVAEVLKSTFEPPLERQVDLGDDDDWLGRVDYVDRELCIVFEIQSDLFHTSVSDRARDRARRERLEAAGWLVVEIPEFDVWHRPDRLVTAVRTARSTARRVRAA